MAHFKSEMAPRGWSPRPGELIAGRAGKREVVGEYLRTRNVGRGCVLAFVKTPDGREVGLNEIKPAKPPKQAGAPEDATRILKALAYALGTVRRFAPREALPYLNTLLTQARFALPSDAVEWLQRHEYAGKNDVERLEIATRIAEGWKHPELATVRGSTVCPKCGGKTRQVLDGEAWCDRCGIYC